MNLQEEKQVEQAQLLKELSKELKYMGSGGTSYRIQTVELAMYVAKNVTEAKRFSNKNSALETVYNLLSSESQDVFRLQDVSKMLHVVWSDLYSKANLPDEVKKELDKRRKNRKYTLVKA